MRNIHESVAAIDSMNGALFGILDCLSLGVVLVGPRCKVHEMNKRAGELVSLDDGIRMDSGTLTAVSHAETAQLHALVERMVYPERFHYAAGEDVVSLSRPSLLPSFCVIAVPLSNCDEQIGEPSAVMFLSDPHWKNDFDPARLGKIYGLTPAEAQLPNLLVQGSCVEEAAEKLCVSLNTVRTHLKQIFSKTGTNRQVEVVRIVLSGVIGNVRERGPARSLARP